MKSNRADITLVAPDVERDAPFAFAWFSHPEGHATLLSMGNAEHEIGVPTLDGEKSTIQEFIDLEKDSKQITRMIVVENKTIGAVWIELFENHGVKSPSVHIIIGDPEYRRKGLGSSVMRAAIDYIINELGFTTIYSRHLASNKSIAAVNKKLGFVADGSEYTDENGLMWQNIKLETLRSGPVS